MDVGSRKVVAIDPVEPNKVADCISKHGGTLEYILNTHHHWDHSGGNEEMKKLYPSVDILGYDERIPGLNKKLDHEEDIKLGSVNIRALLTNCHTRGSISFVVSSPIGEYAVFTGDTLFIAGCGKFFEGTAGDMFRSLETLKALPKETHVYCGHEYTMSNLKFASFIDPDNEDIKEALSAASKLDRTIPSTIEQELLINIFMRTNCKDVLDKLDTKDPVEAMRKLREAKDSFRCL